MKQRVEREMTWKVRLIGREKSLYRNGKEEDKDKTHEKACMCVCKWEKNGKKESWRREMTCKVCCECWKIKKQKTKWEERRGRWRLDFCEV